MDKIFHKNSFHVIIISQNLDNKMKMNNMEKQVKVEELNDCTQDFSTNNETDTTKQIDFFINLANCQEPLGDDFQKVLSDNLFNLYQSSDS